MSWRLRLQHVTRYRYEVPVAASYNEVRMTPLTDDTQITSDATVEVHPTARLLRYWDYWGTLVHAFDLHQDHDELVVTSQATVETASLRPRNSNATWDQLGAPEVVDRWFEYLAPTPHVPAVPFRSVAAVLRAASPTPADAVDTVAAWTHRQLAYEPGATHVATSPAEAWTAGRGVCQDFAHLSLAVLRVMGVPARYVSGYLHPDAEARVGSSEVGQSHAWIEAWTGRWTAVDPTNLVPVGERHVVVGRGREYQDVAPFKGIYSGHGGSDTAVSVEITRLS